MSMDHTEPTNNTPLFATPVWEHGRRRRVSSVTPAPVTRPTDPFHPTHEAGAAGLTDSYTLDRPDRDRTTRVVKSSGPPAAVIAAGVAALAAVAFGGWFVSSRDDGVAELVPGQPAQMVAEAPSLPMVSPTPVAPAQSLSARGSATSERRVASAARARPATTRSATDAGLDASTTLPEAPQPYASAIPAPAPAPMPEASPQITTPEPIPATPPVSADPAPATPDGSILQPE